MRITFLGTGTSCGVPLPTCKCEVCTSTDPRDNRLRCSCLVSTDDGKNILVDCGPDFRQQAIRAKIESLDALLVTHNHFDHVAGLDDLRAFSFLRPLPTYADEIVSKTFLDKYDYIFADLWFDAEDGLEYYLKLSEIEKKNNIKIDYWLETSLKQMRRRYLIELIKEQLEGSDETWYQSEKEIADRIFKTLYFQTKNTEIKSLEDIKELLQ